MSGTPYKIKTEAELVFSFVSEGPKGKIVKVIRYDQFGSSNVYNLGFGDKFENSWKIDDAVITDNGDIRKIMVTVIGTLPLFFEKYPGGILYFKGSDKRRTEIYRWIIEKNLEKFNTDHDVYGEKEDKTEIFQTGKQYDCFYILNKTTS